MNAPLLLLLAGLLAPPALDMPERTQAAARALLDRLGAAFTARDGTAAARCFDFSETLEDAAARKLIRPIERSARGAMATRLSATEAKRYTELGAIQNWQSTRIGRIESLPGGRLRLTVRHRSTPLQTTYRRRYWLRPGLFGWRIYDFEDVDVGIRLSAGLALGLNAALAGDAPPAWLPAAQTILSLIPALAEGESGAVLPTLSGIDASTLPPTFAGMHGLLLAAALYDAGRHTEALKVMDATEARQPQPMPALTLLRADAHLALGQPEPAKAGAEAFLAAFPDDPEALTLRGNARIALKDAAGGVADLERAAADTPPYLDAIVALLRRAPPSRDTALKASLARLSADQLAAIRGALALDAVPLVRLVRLTR